MGPGNESCRDILLDSDRLMLIDLLHSSMKDIWIRSHCDSKNPVFADIQVLHNRVGPSLADLGAYHIKVKATFPLISLQYPNCLFTGMLSFSVRSTFSLYFRRQCHAFLLLIVVFMG